MKNLLRIIILTIVTSFIFSSCSNKLSITKRKYTKGYYVSHSHKKGDVKVQPDRITAKKEAHDNTFETVLVKPSVQKTPTSDADLSLTAENTKRVETKGETETKIKNSDDRLLNKRFFKAKPLEKMIPSRFYTQELKNKLSADHEHEALSLLWIIIVVILILYLLGILFDGFGLGAAIHVLALIALILLILWLLRIL